MTDEEYYGRYLKGDETGIDELVKKYGSPLTLYISGYIRDINEAEDLMIEAFTYLFAKRPRIRSGGLRAYLYKTARHLALRHKSSRKQVFSFEDLKDEPESDILVEEVLKTKEKHKILRLCMEKLNPPYREALFLVYFEGMSHAETASLMGKTEKQIADLVYRGKNSLRKCLEGEGISNADQ